MKLQDRINDNTMLAQVPMRTDRIHKFADLIPVLATPAAVGLAIVGGMAATAVAGSEIGKNAD